jgi:Tfp pilus assembly pilus retraction ATPase PilT
MIERIKGEEINIITIEDPIEYELTSIMREKQIFDLKTLENTGCQLLGYLQIRKFY